MNHHLLLVALAVPVVALMLGVESVLTLLGEPHAVWLMRLLGLVK